MKNQDPVRYYTDWMEFYDWYRIEAIKEGWENLTTREKFILAHVLKAKFDMHQELKEKFKT